MKTILRLFFIISTVSLFCNAQDLNEYIKNGLKFVGEKKHNEAIQSFTMALKIDSNYSEIYCHRGLAKFEIQDFYGAIKDFEMTLEIGHPDERYTFLSLYTLGLSNFNINKYDKAIYYLDSALMLEPNSSDIYFERGKSKINLGEIEAGCEDLSKAGELGNKNAYDFIQQYCVNSVLYEKDINWIKYGETIYFNTFYDPNIIQKTEHIFQVTTKQVFNDRNYEEAKEIIFGKSSTDKYKNMKYMIVRYSIDISNGKTRKDEGEVYNRDNSLIEKHAFEIVYNSMGTDGWQKPIKNGIESSLIDIVKLRYKK